MYTDWLLKMKENEAQTTLEERVVELLAEHKMTVTTAESCTGGLIAATLVNVPGASDVLNEGYITYSNEAKIRLVNVSPETLERYGAVSSQTAKRNGEWSSKGGKSRGCSKRYGNCGTGRRNRGKAGRSGLYRLFCERKDNCEKMCF